MRALSIRRLTITGMALGMVFCAETAALAEPKARPGLFERVFDRQEYERQTGDLRRRERQAERVAAAAEIRAREARRETIPPPLRPRPVSPRPSVRLADVLAERRLADREADQARRRAMQRRMQQYLDGAGNAGRAATQAWIAAARAAQARRVVRGLDRLYAGAAAERNTLGETRDRLSRPLIEAPRVTAE